MSWEQKKFKLAPRTRGCYLITEEVMKNLPELKNYKVGILHLFIQHSSAALTLNENWDPDVRHDMNNTLNKLVPDDGDYIHIDEGPDDMPGHVKSSRE